METRKCLHCGTGFTGNKKKVFCSDLCRKYAHEKKNSSIAQTVQKRAENPRKYADKNPSDEFLQQLFPDATTKELRQLHYKHASLEELQGMARDVQVKEAIRPHLDFILQEILLREAVELSKQVHDGKVEYKLSTDLKNFLERKRKWQERIKEHLDRVNEKRKAEGKPPL